jgi:hypothetical protein
MSKICGDYLRTGRCREIDLGENCKLKHPVSIRAAQAECERKDTHVLCAKYPACAALNCVLLHVETRELTPVTPAGATPLARAATVRYESARAPALERKDTGAGGHNTPHDRPHRPRDRAHGGSGHGNGNGNGHAKGGGRGHVKSGGSGGGGHGNAKGGGHGHTKGGGYGRDRDRDRDLSNAVRTLATKLRDRVFALDSAEFSLRRLASTLRTKEVRHSAAVAGAMLLTVQRGLEESLHCVDLYIAQLGGAAPPATVATTAAPSGANATPLGELSAEAAEAPSGAGGDDGGDDVSNAAVQAAAVEAAEGDVESESAAVMGGGDDAIVDPAVATAGELVEPDADDDADGDAGGDDAGGDDAGGDAGGDDAGGDAGGDAAGDADSGAAAAAVSPDEDG